MGEKDGGVGKGEGGAGGKKGPHGDEAETGALGRHLGKRAWGLKRPLGEWGRREKR